jgi:hypothetical protein
MSCDDIDKQIDAMLDERAERRIRAHLSLCPKCETQWEQIKALRPMLQTVAALEPSDALESRVMAAFDEKHLSTTSGGNQWRLVSSLPGRLRPILAMSLLAVFMAALVGAFVLGRITAPPLVITLPPAVELIDGPSAGTTTGPVPQGKMVAGTLIHIKARTLPSPRKNLAGTKSQAAGLIKSFSSSSEAGANYSTTTSLPGFEPAPDASVRVIKGEEKR